MKVDSCCQVQFNVQYKDNISEIIRNNIKINYFPYTVKLILNNNFTMCISIEISPTS
jgi:hypothetical protein